MARLDNGADYKIFDHSLEATPKRTLFNMSYLHTFNADFGELRPFYLQETVPNDTFTISNDILIRVQPMEVPIMSRIRVFTHYYYMRNNQAWSKWNLFITQGRRGEYNEPFPHIKIQNYREKDDDNEKWYGTFTEESLANALGLPITQYYYKQGQGGKPDSYIQKPKTGQEGLDQIVFPDIIQENDESIKVNAIPFFMYQRIYRDYYMNKNLNQDDKVWFPDDDNDFMLGHAESKGNTNLYHFLPTADPTEETIAAQNNTYKRKHSLFTMRYRNWRDDYFTSAMPWPQRGNPVEIALEGQVNATIPKNYVMSNAGNPTDGIPTPEQYVTIYPWLRNNTGDSTSSFVNLRGEATPKGTREIEPNPNPNFAGGLVGAPFLSSYQNGVGSFVSNNSEPQWPHNMNAHGEISWEALHTPAQTIQVPLSIQMSMEKLRFLSIMQLWKERNGRSDGDYNSLIMQHYGYNPKQPDNTPVYIGGTVQDIVVTEILQQSATDEQAGTALGDGAGHGISASEGYVGEFHCPDYGYIMGIISIVPDVTYTEGIDREWTRETFADYYYPEFNGLGPQGILKKELKLGNNDNDELWAYQERFAEMKHRRNRVSGAMANSHDEYFKQWTMARFFGNNRPTFSQSFVTTKDTVRHEAFTMYEETPFTVQVANKVRAVRPIPYISKPATLIA